MISAEMASHNIAVRQAKDDGDSLIVIGLQWAWSNSPVVVIAKRPRTLIF